MQRALWKPPAVLFDPARVNRARKSVETMRTAENEAAPTAASLKSLLGPGEFKQLMEKSRAYDDGIKAAVKADVAALVAAAQERPALRHDKASWTKAKKKDETKGGKKGTSLLFKVGCRAPCGGPRAHARAPWHAHARRAHPRTTRAADREVLS